MTAVQISDLNVTRSAVFMRNADVYMLGANAYSHIFQLWMALSVASLFEILESDINARVHECLIFYLNNYRNKDF